MDRRNQPVALITRKVIEDLIKGGKLKLRRCCNPICALTTYDKLKQCSDCKCVYYCNKDCQRADSAVHKEKCAKLKSVGENIRKIDALRENPTILNNIVAMDPSALGKQFGVIVGVKDTAKFIQLIESGTPPIEDETIFVRFPKLYYDDFMELYAHILWCGDLPDDCHIAGPAYMDRRVLGKVPVIIWSHDLNHWNGSEIEL